MVANNGTTFVGINSVNDFVYRSTDGASWTRVQFDAEVTNDDAWSGTLPAFRHIVWDGGKFIIYDMSNRVATSADGTTWQEYNSTGPLSELVSQVCATSGHYLAVGIDGVQTSADGITWVAPVIYTEFADRGPGCVIWDGSQYIVGNRYNDGTGAAMLTSPDGMTWTKMPNVWDVTAVQTVSASDNAAVSTAINLNDLPLEIPMP